MMGIVVVVLGRWDVGRGEIVMVKVTLPCTGMDDQR
jgi:hypothetical protein